MGPSGSGKSTLVNVLLGKIAKSSGQIYINGRPDRIQKYTRNVGFVPQVTEAVSLRADPPLGRCDAKNDDSQTNTGAQRHDTVTT
jgi:ABC-type cobalamin/Fe3+-siderophores transport system ATPase subunit